MVLHLRLELPPHRDLYVPSSHIGLHVRIGSAERERDHVDSLYEPARLAWREVQRIDDPREPAAAIALGALATVGEEVSSMLGLAVHLICDHQGIVIIGQRALVDALQQVLEHH